MDLNGVWAYDQVQSLDDNLAKAKGHVLRGGGAALHGTWTRMHLVLVRVENDGSLTVFDEDGHIARFLPVTDAGHPTWTSTTDLKSFAGDSMPKKITPSLVLAAYGDDAPSGAKKGDVYVTSSTDAASVGAQKITVPGTSLMFTWSTGDESLTVDFTPDLPQVGPGDGDDFSATFTGQSHWAQTAFPYYGFNPTRMRIYSEAGAFELPGTPSQSVAYVDNPGQTFIAPLIFSFPAGGSRDYVRSPDLSEQPNLPIGRRWLPIMTHSESSQTSTLSSVADRMTSCSSTLGLSGGVEGMFNVGGEYSWNDKVEAQQRTESRYVVSRSVTISGVDLIHVPSLQLHPDFTSRLEDLTNRILTNISEAIFEGLTDASTAGVPPDWKGFVGHFGTHYLHAMTHGGLKYGETRMSLAAEMKAHTAGYNLSATAEGTLEGGKLESKAEYAAEWSHKLETTVQAEDVDCYEIGGEEPHAIGILYDLRPISELLSPLLVPYNPTTEWGRKAPWVWTDVRASLDAYLTSLGVNEPMDDTLRTDYTPRTVRVSVEPPRVNITTRTFLKHVTLYADITVDAPDLPDVQTTLQTGTPATGLLCPVEDLAKLPPELTFCVVTVKGSVAPKVNVTVLSKLMEFPTTTLAWFTGTLTIDAPVAESGTTHVAAGPIIGTNNTVFDTCELTIPLKFAEVSRMT